MSLELDFFCNSLSFKADIFASCKQVEKNIKSAIFKWWNTINIKVLSLQIKASSRRLFGKRDLQFAVIKIPSDC